MFVYPYDLLHRERERELREAQLHSAARQKRRLERSLRRRERRVARLTTRIAKLDRARPRTL